MKFENIVQALQYAKENPGAKVRPVNYRNNKTPAYWQDGEWNNPSTHSHKKHIPCAAILNSDGSATPWEEVE